MRAILLSTLLLSGPVSAWQGQDLKTGANIDVDRGAVIRNGESIKFYDYGAGEYRTGRITGISFRKGVMDVEIHDEKSDQSRTLVMEN
ncbi:DUF5334 family protein [Pseudomonas sp. PDM16]|uniref:DUF5334 family protein n=1 Tax=Pseudomonas sp. PDM16 TaxID=2769292 RepID=UPI0017816525|nr:DUF5334 family protein [Pseudomonas sp. PDM16]MBD9414650.1 DUF5334 family protein [Pseudomonas sp. PDM16]